MESSKGAASDAPMNPQSLYAALGLSPEDVEALAKIPENEISVETLPYLIMQLKAKRAEKESATPTTTATDTDSKDQTEAEPKHPEEKAEPQPETPSEPQPETQPETQPVPDSEQPNLEPPEKSKEKRGSPPSSSSSRRSEGHTSNHDHEHHGRGDHRRTERQGPAGRRDSRHRKSSRERQSEALEMELDDSPTDFPHVCSICKIKVNDSKAWSSHLRVSKHIEARRELMRFSYSEDDSYSSRRGSRSAVPSKRSYSSEKSTGDLSSSSDRHYSHYMPFTKVVVAKFPMGCVAVADMLALGKPFGTIVKHLIFPFKGFLEFSSHTEAKNMVTHYSTKHAFIKGHRISLCLSPTVEVIHPPEVYEPTSKRSKSSQCVVCLSRLPVGKEIEEEVLEIASMFGDVRQSKFTEDKALIEMVDWRDADIMVKYYHSNALRIQDKSIKVSISSVSSLRDSSPEHSSSKKSHSSSKQKSESSKGTPQSGNKEKDKEKEKEKEKSKSSSKEPCTAEAKPEKEKEGEEEEKEKKEGEEAGKTEEEVKNVEGTQLEDQPTLVETEAADSTDVTMKEPEQKEEEGGEEKERPDEEERTPAETEGKKGDTEEDVAEQDDLEDMDFPDNLDDFVTLDELDSTTGDLETSELQDGKVVVIRPIRREFRETRKKAVREALYKMATPFGEVINFAISYYRHEALIELESVEKAHEMVNFYKNRKKSKLVGRPVSVSISLAFKRIEGPSGRSLFISMLPTFKYSDMALLRLAQPFGKITAYCSNRVYRTCYIQMETREAAEKMIHRYSRRPLKFYGAMLKITMCKKGDSLIPWTPADKFERWCETRGIKSPRGDEKKANGQTSRNSTGENRHSPMSSCEGEGGDPVCGGGESEEEKPQSPLGPYEPNNPVGVDYVVPKSGFFCKLCNMFYTDEKKAKSEHCSSLEHYNMLKKKRGEVEEEPQAEEPTDEGMNE